MRGTNMFNLKLNNKDIIDANSATPGIAVKSDDETLIALRQMLDAMPVNVMTCDLFEFTIDYVNKTSLETLRRLEHLLPRAADDLLGQSIDISHKAPEHQRKILSDPSNLPW